MKQGQAGQYQDIAKKFVDMWQDQLANVMTDKDFVSSMLDTMQNFSYNSAQETPENYDKTTRDAAVSPGSVDPKLGELERRLAASEQRIAVLESALALIVRNAARSDAGMDAASPKRSAAGKSRTARKPVKVVSPRKRR